MMNSTGSVSNYHHHALEDERPEAQEPAGIESTAPSGTDRPNSRIPPSSSAPVTTLPILDNVVLITWFKISRKVWADVNGHQFN